MNEEKEYLRLFRFRSINEYLWQELELSELFTGERENLNDPFDCQIDPFNSLNRAMKNNDRTRINFYQEILEAFNKHNPMSKSAGVCCFTKTMENHLLWSHYADGHRGICLLYEIPAKYVSEKYSYDKCPDYYHVGSTSVNYGDDSYYDWLVNGDLDDPIPGSYIINAAANLLKCKSNCWDYEKEFRILMSNEGSIELEPNFLKQVTFGLRTTQKQERLIRSMIKTEVQFVKTERNPESDFGLKFTDID